MARILFENGILLEAQSFGAPGVVVGEAVFNTAMSGYEEVISDPSYSGQFVIFSVPEIGVVGVNGQDCQSQHNFCAGVVVRHYPTRYSNFRAKQSLGAFLNQHGVLGISGVDTRALVGMLRDEGAMQAIISTQDLDRHELQTLLDHATKIANLHLIPSLTHPKPNTQGVFDFRALDYPTLNPPFCVGVLDFGVKQNILNNLVQVGLKPLCFAPDSKAHTLIEAYQRGEIRGILISNGPGDPLKLTRATQEIATLIEAKIPMLGICLGHQLLSIAHGFPTYKLRFGHHGSNHPVLNLATRRIEISAQNHNYCVSDHISQVATITHQNLFDGTIEGVRYLDAPIFSVQHHPEASPGPSDGLYIFKEFARLVSHANT
ncbi:glutamine-hydrolyzing carbamoyl-phosphate synthase small subunit [Helicobacter bizzozeronii]|uniref:glutamine-hydrolyzing carbamoyl-phosphate synthase small subunit n=1 Tax=Helicobacter bizzozeronii TaxID=56877 RepID=UPI000CEF0DC5|nr:glutamine-hydrolyzing carbamoyl-phosphate synthase small subunit [Helicobacter bizzozeronii]